MNAWTRRVGAAGVVLAVVACDLGGTGGDPAATIEDAVPEAALASVTAEDLLRHTAALSADSMEGRGPGTAGEEKTVRYLESQFRALGLAPGNPDGTYVQDVPLVGITTETSASTRIGGTTQPFTFPDDFVGVSRRTVPEIHIADSDIVFVGYGVVAPEYDWNDFKDVDVAGKTIVMLINDPAIRDAADTTMLDDALFNGNAMTYYGRWTYKYEIASEKSAAAAIVVHETGPAGYPWEVVTGSWGRENFDIDSGDGNAGRVAVEAWMTDVKARALFQAAGLSFDSLKTAALSRDFRPVTLPNATASFDVTNTVRQVASRNVVAKLEGGDPARANEVVVYTAHWDHLGRDTSLEGDQIFNGALDNATGTAALLELAEAYATQPTPPDRSILFLAVTAEEYGLLGAKHYATNPLYPLDRTLANINIDGLNQWGRTSDIVVVGYGNSTLEDVLAGEAIEQNREIRPDPEPEKGFFYRSDHFEFAKQGVPALYTDNGTAYIGKPEGYSQQKREEYTNIDYHKVSDEVKPDWDLSGAVEDVQLLFRVGWRVAGTEAYPEWKEGTEFKARREEMLRRRDP
jgi:Zn-dependent M28 family amino/carboxypeptidase